MGFKSDIEIAQAAVPEDIRDIAAKLGLKEDDLDLYGKYKAKVDYNLLKTDTGKNPRLILVTAINPTPAGEGKTTTTIGLADALALEGQNVLVALREPSLGPVFGVKGGAAGGGYAQVLPMEDINLHFTGDFHAIGAANNLLAAMIDNHIQQGNELGINPKKITWRRCVDMNDRQLRNIVDGLGKPTDGVTRQDGFDITVASEIMAAFCLADDISDLRDRLGKIIIGYTYRDEPVTAAQLKANGAMAARAWLASSWSTSSSTVLSDWTISGPSVIRSSSSSALAVGAGSAAAAQDVRGGDPVHWQPDCWHCQWYSAQRQCQQLMLPAQM